LTYTTPPRRPGPDTILFDLDGTLLDSIGLILESYHHTLEHHGLPPKDDAYWLAGIGTPLRAQLREWADDPGLLEALIATYREYNHSNHDLRVRAYPGITEALHELRARRVRMAVVTSKMRRGALRGLRLVGLAEKIDVLVGADDVARPKPAPDPVFHALRLLGTAPHGAVFVGDSVHDMEAGRSAGVRTAAALWGPFERRQLEPATPDYWLDHPEDLLNLVDGGSIGANTV
jgi:pyrophosphatase PpaX